MYRLSSSRRAVAGLLLTAVAPIAAQAQEQQLFTWTGRVDREVRLTVRGNQVMNSTEPNMQTRGRVSVNSALPAQYGTLRVVTQSGRGMVAVDQQPTAQNGYTAIIRIDDNDGGADNYRVAAYFDRSGVPGRYGTSGGDVYDANRDGRIDRRDDRNGDGRIDARDERGGRFGRNDEPMLHWSGDVDGSVELVLRNGGVSQRVINGASLSNVRSNITGNMGAYNQSTSVQLNVREGRGRVEVLQQPTARNRYTTVIRIVDPQSGYGHYNLDVAMQ